MTRWAINVRASSGAGKSTAVRSVLDTYHTNEQLIHPTSGMLLGHRLTKAGQRDLIVLGKYTGNQSNNQGGDHFGFSSLSQLKLLEHWWDTTDCHLLFEKVNLPLQVTPFTRLKDHGLNLHLVHIIHPLIDRLKSRGGRRMQKKGEHNNRITAEFHVWDVQFEAKIAETTAFHESDGIPVSRVTRDTVVPTILGLLNE